MKDFSKEHQGHMHWHIHQNFQRRLFENHDEKAVAYKLELLGATKMINKDTFLFGQDSIWLILTL